MQYIKTFESHSEESPLQGLIDKMNLRINDPNVTTKKLAEIFLIAAESREGLLEAEGDNTDSDWWAHKAILDLTEILVKCSYKAHQILNPDLVEDDLDDQIKNALEEIKKQFK